MKKDESFWQNKLTKEQYSILRQASTEPAFSSKLNYNKDTGEYKCAACSTILFDSSAKFDSGSGWPSFTHPVNESVIEYREDSSHGMRRVEVLCSNCSSHLGHVFPDGPSPGGNRFCINGLALNFEESDK